MQQTILIFTTFLLISCSGNGTQKKIDEIKKVENSKIEKIDSKREKRNDGEFNQMTIFSVDSTAVSNDIKEYCSEHKSYYSNGYFQILVFFKDKSTATFPDNPITGGFLEDKDLKNIKAIYTLNNINGYSKLNYYDKNSYESLSKTFDIQ